MGCEPEVAKPLPVASFRVIPRGEKRTRLVVGREREADCETDYRGDEDDSTDEAFERRHEQLVHLERKGFAVRQSTLSILRRSDSRDSTRSSQSSQSLAEAKLSLATPPALGKPSASDCPACPPWLKHVAHVCDRAVASNTARGSSPPPCEPVTQVVDVASGCLACPPHGRHVAHTCGRTYVGKRYGRRRKPRQSGACQECSLAPP